MRFGTVAAGTACVVALATTGASARPIAAPTYNGPEWIGTVTATYTGSGSINNGNCPSCMSTSKESANVTETITEAGAKITGTVSLHETNTYNSQCTGTTTRVETDQGSLSEKSATGVSVQPYPVGQAAIGFNPPLIPYKGTLKSEATSTVNGVKVCKTLTQPSSGNFAIPAVVGQLIGKGDPDKLSHLSGNISRDVKPCGVPRTACTVTITWSLSRATCNPNALLDGLRELERAKGFLEQAQTTIENRQEEFKDWAFDFGKEEAGLIALKKGLKKILVKISEGAVKAGTGAAEAAEVVDLLYNAALLQQILRDQHGFDTGATNDLAHAKSWLDKAVADLAEAEHGPCVTKASDQLHKALAQQAIDDQARALIDTWDHSQVLYRDPATGDVVNEHAALDRAKQILSSRKTQAASPLTRQQVEEAIVQVDRALTDHARVKNLVDKYLRLLGQTVTKLKALLG
jgi:hypothetical protein